jgi:hypothetical protein
MVIVRLVIILVLGAVGRSSVAPFLRLCLSRFVFETAPEFWYFPTLADVLFSPFKVFTRMAEPVERKIPFVG